MRTPPQRVARGIGGCRCRDPLPMRGPGCGTFAWALAGSRSPPSGGALCLDVHPPRRAISYFTALSGNVSLTGDWVYYHPAPPTTAQGSQARRKSQTQDGAAPSVAGAREGHGVRGQRLAYERRRLAVVAHAVPRWTALTATKAYREAINLDRWCRAVPAHNAPAAEGLRPVPAQYATRRATNACSRTYAHAQVHTDARQHAHRR
jgi:hypothetical protein